MWVIAFHAAIVTAQDDATTWFNKGAKATSPQEKIICYTQAIALNPKFIEAYYNLGYVYKSMDDYANAEKAFREALRCDPDKLSTDDILRISYELGITLKKLNRLDAALEMLLIAKNLAVKTEIRAAVLYEIGKLKVSRGNFDEAIAEFNEGLQLRSTKQDAFQSAIQSANALKTIEDQYAQGVSYFDNGQYEQAIALFAQVVEKNPNYKDASLRLARAQSTRNQRAQTEELERAYARGIGYLQISDWKNAILAFNQVNQSNPDYKDVRNKLDEAKAKLDQSLIAEGYEKLYGNGMAAYTEKDWIKAIMAFEKIMEWNPNYKNIRTMYANAQNQLNQEEQSTIKMRYYNQAQTDLASGDLEAAIASFEQLIRIDPNFRDTQQLLRQARNELQNKSETSQLEKLYAEGNTYFDAGNWLQAIIVFEKLQQLQPGYLDVAEKILLAHKNSSVPDKTDLAIDSTTAFVAETPSSGKLFLAGVIISIFIIPLGIIFFIVPTGKAKFLLLQGKQEQAAQIYESILLKNPHKVKLYPELARIYLIQNRKDDAALKVYSISLEQNIKLKLKERLLALTDQKIIPSVTQSEVDRLEEQLKSELEKLKNKTN